MHSELWVEEKYRDFLGLRMKVEEVLFSEKSEFQTVDVVKTLERYLMMDCHG